MAAKKNQDQAWVTQQSWKKSGKIAFFFLLFGVAWILISDTVSVKLFSDVQHVVEFAIIKGLTYVLLSTLLILYLSFTNIRQILRKSMVEAQDKEKIEEQHSLMKALTNATTDLVFYKDSDFRYIGCNRAFEEFIGCSEKDLIGKSSSDLFVTETAELRQAWDREVFRSGKSIRREEQVTYPEGRAVWMETSKSPIYDDKGRFFGLVGVSRDISERKAMILQLEKEKKQFETFINSSRDLIFLKDDHFRYLIANRALADFYGKEIRELIGKTDYELMSKENADACRVSDTTAVTGSETLDSVETVDDRIFQARKFPVAIDLDKTGVGAIIRDSTNEYRQKEIISQVSETNRIIAECMTKPFENVQQQLDYVWEYVTRQEALVKEREQKKYIKLL